MHFSQIGDSRDQKTLESLQAERQEKIDELKERTNYYTTQQLIQVHNSDLLNHHCKDFNALKMFIGRNMTLIQQPKQLLQLFLHRN